MTERPILLNADMVRAVLDGRKTQTRRPILPNRPASPFGYPGDALWVRETWLYNGEPGAPYRYRADSAWLRYGQK